MKNKILVVDDEKSARKLLDKSLSPRGYEVSLCEDGEIALSKIQAGFTPDLVITDLLMPGMNGLELTRSIKASMPGLPVIIMTGTPDQLPGQNPAEAVIVKPFELKNLLRIVNLLIK